MKQKSKLIKLLAPVVCLMVLAASCSSGDEERGEVGSDVLPPADDVAVEADEEQEAEAPVELPSDTLVWVHDQEPGDLHFDDPTNNLPVTAWIRSPMIEGLFGVDSSLSYYPELLAGDADVSQDDDGTISIDYTLRSGLTWSDGIPLTSADVAYTHQILTEGCETEADGSIIDGGGSGCVYWDGDRSGLDLVTGFDVTSDTEFSITMANFFAGWRGLYDEVYAAHAFGQDAAAVNENVAEWMNERGDVLPSSGPMVFDSWERGSTLRMVRNDAYHGSASPDARNDGPATVEAVRIDFVAGTEELMEAMRNGAAHVMMTQPTPELVALAGAEGIAVAATPGPAFEHLGLNVLNPHLAKAGVREALAYALDKADIVDQLFVPLVGPVLAADGLGNTYWMPNQAAYEDHQSKYAGSNVDQAVAALVASGYVEGSDGVYTHPTDGRLTLRIGTTGGNFLREQTQQLIQMQLAAAGIELTIDNVPGGLYFNERPYSEAALAAATTAGAEGNPNVWDITQFGWVGGPWPGGQSASYRASNPNNPYGYANPEFDVRASECDVVFDDQERAACYNELDTFVTTLDKGDGGLFMLPLTQKPSFFAYLDGPVAAAAVAPDDVRGGPLANVVDYQIG